MKVNRRYRAIGIFGALFPLLTPILAHATTYAVKLDGSANFTSIQACANAARAGDTCLVNAGTYNEYVRTAAGGTSDSARVTFKAQGIATMQGFDIRHPYVTVEGFDITGFSGQYQGHITIYADGDHCRVIDNTVRDGLVNVYGIYFYTSSGQSASSCVVQGNRVDNLLGTFLTTAGDHHLFERNTFERQNSRDLIRLFGTDHVFRHNIFWRGTEIAGTGNHPDFMQTFGAPAMSSENHLFEENWIENLLSQFGQMNSGDGQVFNGILYDNVKNVTFRRNVIVNVSNNANIGLPGMRFENNTFYRMATTQSGIGYGGSLTRGYSPSGVLTNNIFLEGGVRATSPGDSTGFYSNTGALLSREVIGVFATQDPPGQTALTQGIYNDLIAQGYTDANGVIKPKAAALTDISQFVLNAQYAAYKAVVYDLLIRTVAMDTAIRSTFLADYNFVAGAASAGFPAKRDRECPTTPVTTYTTSNFCEPHGINGGNPGLANLANVLGPDGIPFTLDDGLKPPPTSVLCGKGIGGSDIGAYSCDPTKVFPSGSPPVLDPPPPPTTPPPPTQPPSTPPPSGPLPTPTLNLPSHLPVNGTLTANYPSGYTNISYQWTISEASAGSSGTSVPALGVIAPASSANFQTLSNMAALSSYALVPGDYRITVRVVDGQGNTSAQAEGFVTLVSVDFSDVRVFPNPWRKDRHNGHVTFDGLPLGSTVKLFSVSGHHAKTLTAAVDSVSWDLTNSQGDKVASGIYIYVIKAGESSGSDSEGKVRGKIVVIK